MTNKTPFLPYPARRAFMKQIAAGASVALVAGAGTLAPCSALAVDLPHLDERDPAAAALGYVEDATKLDKKRFPDVVPGSICANCLQLQGKAGADYRPCNLFPGKLVASAGWCSGWTPEM